MNFNIGDKVIWTSQAGSYSKTKQGIILAVIPPNKPVRNFIPDGYQIPEAGLIPRKEISYLVRQGKSINLNWPRTCHLKLFIETQPPKSKDER